MTEVACLFQTYADASALKAVALKAVMILPALILQKPFRTSKSKDHVSCIERDAWCCGEKATYENSLRKEKPSRIVCPITKTAEMKWIHPGSSRLVKSSKEG